MTIASYPAGIAAVLNGTVKLTPDTYSYQHEPELGRIVIYADKTPLAWVEATQAEADEVAAYWPDPTRLQALVVRAHLNTWCKAGL